MIGIQLLNFARVLLHIPQFKKYVVDGMAREKHIPPYHCELNSNELILAQIRNQVAREKCVEKLYQL